MILGITSVSFLSFLTIKTTITITKLIIEKTGPMFGNSVLLMH